MADCPSVCEHLHLPVQSGEDEVLHRMGRQYSVDAYLELVARLRAAVPGISLTTDVIVGFCGETEAQFEATLDLLREVRFDQVFAAAYSPRPGTPAAGSPTTSRPSRNGAGSTRCWTSRRASDGSATRPGWGATARCSSTRCAHAAAPSRCRR